MKRILMLLMFFTLCGCNLKAQRTKISTNNEVVKMLIKNKLNLQFFELSFVLPELAYVIENDTTGLLDKRIQNAFDEGLSDDIKYIHSLGLNFLISRFESNDSLQLAFQGAFEKVKDKKSYLNPQPDKDYSEIYTSYIQYPEQVDDATIITLLTAENCDIYEKISKSETAKYHFNNWLQYGFDEFRYYPDSEDPVKKEINDNIVKWINKNVKCPKSSLVLQAKEMMKETVDSY